MSGIVHWKKTWRRVPYLEFCQLQQENRKTNRSRGVCFTLGGKVRWDGVDWLRIWETPVQGSGQEGDQCEKRVMLELSVRDFLAGRRLQLLCERGALIYLLFLLPLFS